MSKEYTKFKKTFKKWVDTFGLKSWKISYECGKDIEVFGTICQAYINYDIENRTATVFYNTNTEGDIRTPEEVALHEALHLLFAPYTHHATSRYTTNEFLENEEHNIINILEDNMKETKCARKRKAKK